MGLDRPLQQQRAVEKLPLVVRDEKSRAIPQGAARCRPHDPHRAKVLDIVAPLWTDESMSDDDVLRVIESPIYGFVDSTIQRVEHLEKQVRILQDRIKGR